MTRAEDDLKEIKKDQKELLTVFIGIREDQQKFMERASGLKKTVFRKTKSLVEEHKAETDQKLKEHKESCPVLAAEKKSAESPFPWGGFAKTMFMVGAGAAILVSGFLYQLGASPATTPTPTATRTASAASGTATP